MIPLDEFYNLSLEEQEKFVDGGYVVVDGELADEFHPVRERTSTFWKRLLSNKSSNY